MNNNYQVSYQTWDYHPTGDPLEDVKRVMIELYKKTECDEHYYRKYVCGEWDTKNDKENKK